MNKQLKRKSRKIIACMICLVTFFGGLTIPAKAETASVSSNHYSVSSNNCTVSSNHYSASLKGFRRSSANSVVEPRSTEEKFYQRIDGLTEQSDLSGTYVIANVENETGNCAAMSARKATIAASYLESDNINSSLRNDKKYMLAAGLTEWTFEKAESSSGVGNYYYISTVVDGQTEYFAMSERDNGIFIQDDYPSALKVEVLQNGRIKISNASGNELTWNGNAEDSMSIFCCSFSTQIGETYKKKNERFTLYGTTYHKVEDIDKNKDLSGTYVIANEDNDATYYAAMSANSSSNGRLDSNNIEKHLSENHKYINGLELTEWTFERSEGNAYSISTKVNGKKMYLNLGQGDVGNEFEIKLVENKTLVNVDVNSEERICISNPNNSNSRLDWYGGSTKNKTVFGGWSYGTPSKNNYFTLYTREKTYQKLSNVSQETDLSGTYVIANVQNDKNYWAAMSTDSKRFNNVDCLSANIIEKDRFASNKYISGIEFTEWTFEKSEGNAYSISTMVNGQKRYLKLWNTTQRPGEFSIQLVNDENLVKVDVNSEGRICISNPNDSNSRLDWYGGSAGPGYNKEMFGGYGQQNRSDNNLFNLYRIGTEMDPVLYYDVNLPTESAMGVPLENSEYRGHWVEAELISAVKEEQHFSSYSTDASKLNSPETPADGYFTFEKETYYQSQQIINTLKNHQLSSGKDFEFTGWSVTVDGKEYLFGKDAEASVASDKIDMIRITEGEKSVCVPYGTELKGTWTQISDILSFYINKNGTVLDTEGDVARRDVQKFTGSLGVCRVYYANEIVGGNDTYGKDADEKICSLIVREPDMTTKEIKVVIDYVIGENGDLLSVKDKGYLAENLETAVLKYFKEQKADIKICSPFTKEAIGLNPENCDTNHYGTRWYVLKEDVSDFVHIDGVLEAKTGQILVTKSVYGLDENAITDMEKEFQISAELKDHVSGEYQSYITLKTADDENNAVYRYQRDENSFRWTMNALKDEVYAFEEKNYIADDLYASLVEITERDGGKRTVVLDADKSLTDINVSEVKEIHFKNYYVPVQETGVLSIVKTDAQDTDKKLKNAEFTLTPEGAESAEAVVRTTDAEGIVRFENLQSDVTYLLKETKAPEGYQKTDKTWTVKVSLQEEIAEDGKYIESVVVKIFDNSKNGDEGTICYSYDEIVEYEISNTPETKDDGGSGQPPENEPTDDKKPTGNKKPTGGKKPSSEQKPIVEQKPTDEQKPAENKGGIIPTGDSAKTMLMCGLLVCSIVALCVMGYFKRKK